MSKMVYMGAQLEEMTDRDLLVAKRDIEDCRAAVAIEMSEATAVKCFDDDLEELRGEIRSRPGLSEQPALPRSETNIWLERLRAAKV